MLDTVQAWDALTNDSPAMRQFLAWVWGQKAEFILNALVRGGQGFSIH